MIRESPIAGTWYAGTKEQLEIDLGEMFTDNEFGPGDDPKKTDIEMPMNTMLGIISPHAGYVYSGRIAAWGFRELYLNNPKVDTFIILGPNHGGMGPGISIYPEGKWRFPLADVDVDNEIVDYIKQYNLNLKLNHFEFETSAHIREHSIDIQIPFIQYLFGKQIKIVPICLADQSLDSARITALMLENMIKHFPNKIIKIVASTDLSHESDYNTLTENDSKMVELIANETTSKIDEFRKSVRMTMCGYGAVYTLLELGKLLGYNNVNLLKYSNSKLIKPQANAGYTVGYSSFTIT